MKLNTQSVLAIVLCILLYLGYTYYLNTKYPDYGKKPQPTEETQQKPGETPQANTPATGSTTIPATPPQETTSPKGPVGQAKIAPAPSSLSEKDLIFETDTSVYKFNQDLSALESIKLKAYKEHLADEAMISLVDNPLVIQGSVTVDKNDLAKGFAGERQGRTIKFSRNDGPWLISNIFTIPEKGYGADIKIRFVNTGSQHLDLNAGTFFSEMAILTKPKSGFMMPGGSYEKKSLIANIDGVSEWTEENKFCTDDEPNSVATKDAQIDFLGFDRHYFLTVFLPEMKKLNLTKLKDKSKPVPEGFCPLLLKAYQPFGMIPPGGTAEIAFSAYFGPKVIETMIGFDKKLSKAMDYGWFDAIARPLLQFVKWLYNSTGNYGIAIIILTLVIKIIFFPLTKQSAVSMAKMKKLQPEMQKIREKHKEDPQTQQRELMKFMSTNKINPMKGCLPIIPQIPVFFALFRMLSASIELRHAPFFGWIRDLSAADPYYISPLFLGVLMFVQQKLTPTTGMDKNQEKIMMFMPIIFTLMMLTLPSGLVVYMVTNSITSIIQQQWLNKKLK